MAAKKSYPFEIHTMDVEKMEELRKDHMLPIGDNEDKSKNVDEYICIGPKKYVFPLPFKSQCEKIYNMELKSDDIFVVTFPRSGTTWTQEMVWLLANDLDYDKASATYLTERFPFIESSMFMNEEFAKFLLEVNKDKDEKQRKALRYAVAPLIDFIDEIPSPRYFKTHLPISLLPANLLDKTKVVYVARNPKDVVVSYYYHIKNFKVSGYDGQFKNFWNFFMKDMLAWTPFFEHAKEAWALRDHPNLLFLFYEDISKDLPATLRRIAKFLGKEYTDDQLDTLREHLKIDNFRKNKAVNYDEAKQLDMMSTSDSFIRQGKTGGWREHFDDEMLQITDKWIADNLQDTDMRYPEI